MFERVTCKGFRLLTLSDPAQARRKENNKSCVGKYVKNNDLSTWICKRSGSP